ncbi:MAG: FecR family protein, partial [Arenicellales bacterium]
MGIRTTASSLVAILVVFQGILSAYAQSDCQELAGHFLSLEGTVDVQSDQTGSWASASLDQQLCKGDTVRVSSLSRAAVSLVNDAVLRLDENTTMRLLDITAEQEERSFLDLLRGAFHSFSRKPRLLSVNTPYLNGSIEGTEFVFRVKEGESILTVFEGTVVASNEQGSIPVSHGESVAAVAGQAPQPRTLVRPRDASQWSLYYPPLLAAGVDRNTPPA